MHIKHKELIQAWLDGAKIEMMDADGIWRILENPNFREYGEYRVYKPDVPIPEWYFVDGTRPEWLNDYATILCSNSDGRLIGPVCARNVAFTRITDGVTRKILFIRIVED